MAGEDTTGSAQGEVAFAAASDSPAAASGDADGAGTEELEVSVRLLEEGALVRWKRARGDTARCSVHWYEGDRLLDVAHTYQDYLLGEYLICSCSRLRL